MYESGTIIISYGAALNNLKLIATTYKDGRITVCKIKSVSVAAGAEYQESISITDNAKIMLCSGFDNMRPIWKYERYETNLDGKFDIVKLH